MSGKLLLNYERKATTTDQRKGGGEWTINTSAAVTTVPGTLTLTLTLTLTFIWQASQSVHLTGASIPQNCKGTILVLTFVHQ